jgi:hypothetical protein
MGAT